MVLILKSMSTRLQIVMTEEEAEGFRRSAARTGLTLSEWARRALRRAQKAQASKGPEDKLRALERALTRGHPTADVAEMLADIEKGRDLR